MNQLPVFSPRDADLGGKLRGPVKLVSRDVVAECPSEVGQQVGTKRTSAPVTALWLLPSADPPKLLVGEEKPVPPAEPKMVPAEILLS